MAEKMMAYIGEQPSVWRRILEGREDLFRGFRSFFRGRDFSRILIIGSGSSYNAAAAAADFYGRQLGLEAYAAVPSRAGRILRFLDPASGLVFALSQSGRSTSTLDRISDLRRRGFTVAGFTADEQSPVAKACGCHQIVACGEETVGPKTKGMTGSILTLYLAGMALAEESGRIDAGESGALCRALADSFAAAEGNLVKCRSFCREHAAVFSRQPHITLVSDGFGFYAAREGALKILETLYIPAHAYEFEEYLHGIQNTVEPGLCNLFLPAAAGSLEPFCALDRFCREKGCLDFTASTLDLSKGAPENTLELAGSGCAFTVPFEALPFFQLLGAYGSEAKKIDCDTPKFPGFYERMGTKIPAEEETPRFRLKTGRDRLKKKEVTEK